MRRRAESEFKQVYWKAIKRAYEMSTGADGLRRKILLERGLLSLKRKVEFRALKMQMVEICAQRYEDSLRKNGFKVL